MSKPRALQVGLACAILLLLALPGAMGLFGPGERALYDLQLRAFPLRPDPRVLLVCRDEETFSALGDRIPNRAEMAQVLLNLQARGADLVVLDILLLARSSEEEDAALESALSKVDTILASSPAQKQEPLPRFSAQSVTVASIDLVTDPDGVLRAVPAPYLKPEGDGFVVERLPLSLAAALATVFPQGAPSPEFDPDGLRFGNLRFPTRDGSWLIPFAGGEGTLPRVSLLMALRDPEALPDLRGKVVLVGSTKASEHDAFGVPMHPKIRREGRFEERRTNTMAGVEIQGQALSAQLQGRRLTAPSPADRWMTVGVTALVALGLLFTPFGPSLLMAFWLLGLIALPAIGALLFRGGHTMPLFSMLAIWCAAAASSLAHRWFKDFEGRRAVEKLFGRYLSPNIARQLLKNPDLVQFGGHKKVLSILESDIRGFTNLSERLQPEQVTMLLNEYFTAMTRILFEHDGTLDKFIGDAMLAFFGDPVDLPDHSARAVACAVAMQEESARLREKFRAEGKPELRIGVAVHAGPVVVGNHGSLTNFDYTVIGDTVNLTARLQGLAQSDDVIVTCVTARSVPDFQNLYDTREMEPVMVKGKSEPIEIVSIRGRKAVQ